LRRCYCLSSKRKVPRSLSLYGKAFQANEFRSANAVIGRKHRRLGLGRPRLRQPEPLQRTLASERLPEW
jgi:hypothetical protein